MVRTTSATEPAERPPGRQPVLKPRGRGEHRHLGHEALDVADAADTLARVAPARPDPQAGPHRLLLSACVNDVQERGVAAIDADERPSERLPQGTGLTRLGDPGPGGDRACGSHRNERIGPAGHAKRGACRGIVLQRRDEDPAARCGDADDPAVA